MADGKYVLAMYDVRGKQEFIFRTNKLQEIVGGSWLIRDVFQDYLYPAAKEYMEGCPGIYAYQKGEQFSVSDFENRINAQNYIGEVVYEGGGNFLVLFKDEETFKKITYLFTKKVMEEIGTLRVLGTCIEIESFDDYSGKQTELYRKHRKAEAQESNISPWSCLPIVQVDRKTSQPLVDYPFEGKGISADIEGRIHFRGVRGKLTKESTAKLIKYHDELEKISEDRATGISDPEKEFFKEIYRKNEYELDKLVTEKGKDSLLAVVYIDGNNMGAKVQKLTDKSNTFEESVNKLRRFSEETQKTYVEEGANHALSGLKDDKKDKNYRIVVSAGDEINFIVNAHDAFSCAQNYLSYLKSKDGASACAGIAVFHSHDPYADVYRIAEEACESGKQKMKAAEIQNASFIDFHICQGAIGVSLEEIREEENGDIISRPWMMWAKDEKNEKREDVIHFETDVNETLKFLKRFARSNVKGLMTAAKEGVVPLQMEMNRMYGHASQSNKEKWKKDWDVLKGKLYSDKGDRIRAIVYDLSLAYDLWFAKWEDAE